MSCTEWALVDVLAPAVKASWRWTRSFAAIAASRTARSAMHKVRAMAQPISLEGMMAITAVWVETALQLGEKSLRTMERLVRAQYRRHGEPATAHA